MIWPLRCVMWIIIGAVAGGLARRIMGEHDAPVISDMILGWIGAAVALIVLPMLGFDREEIAMPWLCANIFISTLGAVGVIWIGRFISGRREKRMGDMEK